MYHFFDIDVAKEYGVDQAILIAFFQFWINHNAANKTNYHDGKFWTYNSYRALSMLFPYYSEKQIRRIVGDLVEKQVLTVGNFNKKDFDKTSWYAFINEPRWLKNMPVAPSGTSICSNGQMVDSNTFAQSGGSFAQTGTSFAQQGQPIPVTNEPQLDNTVKNKRNKNNKQDDPAGKAGSPPVNSDDSKNGKASQQVPPVADPPQDPTVEVVEGVKLPKGLYPLMNDSYFKWFKSICNGTDPKFNKGEGAALKEMVWYFYKGVIARAKEREEVYSHEEICIRANNAFLYVLKGLESESKIDPFLKAAKKLVQINSNLTNIIDQLKNGNPKDKQPSISNKATATDHYSSMAEQLERERQQTTG